MKKRIYNDLYVSKCQYYGNNKSFIVKDFNILSETDRWFRKLNCKKLKCKK